MALLFVAGDVQGVGTATAEPQPVFIFSGFAFGTSTLFGSTTIDVSGSVMGSVEVDGTLVQAILMPGLAEGVGSLRLSVPEPILGVGTLVGYVDFLRIPCPICGCCPCRSHHDRDRGDRCCDRDDVRWRDRDDD